MNLLRFRKTTKTVALELPDGSTRLVKVETEDHGTVQHVHDWEGRVHGTGRLIPFGLKVREASPQRTGMLLRNLGMPKMRQAFSRNHDTGPWVPVPGTEQMR